MFPCFPVVELFSKGLVCLAQPCLVEDIYIIMIVIVCCLDNCQYICGSNSIPRIPHWESRGVTALFLTIFLQLPLLSLSVY